MIKHFNEPKVGYKWRRRYQAGVALAIMSCPIQGVHHPWAVDSMQANYVGDLAQNILSTAQAVICDRCQQPLTLLSTAWTDLPTSVGRGHTVPRRPRNLVPQRRPNQQAAPAPTAIPPPPYRSQPHERVRRPCRWS